MSLAVMAARRRLLSGRLIPLSACSLTAFKCSWVIRTRIPRVLDLLDHAADLAVVEPYRLPRPDVVEHLRNRAADHCRGQDLSRTVVGRGATRLEIHRGSG